MIRALFQELRPKQWSKNLFVFAPLLFGKLFLRPDKILQAVAGFFLFSAVASAAYILNDIVDAPRDRLHPLKKERPIASGRLPALVAAGFASLAFGGAMAYALTEARDLAIVLGVYAAINVVYTLGLKHVVILDIMAIGIGFVLRVFGGAVAIHVEPSRWLLTCTIFISLFLAACKRRGELSLVGEAGETRAVLRSYSVAFVDQVISLAAAGTILSYALYTLDPETIAKLGTRDLIFTLPFVIYGVLRYMHIVQTKGEGDNPTELLLRDRWMQLTVVAYVGTVAWLLLALTPR